MYRVWILIFLFFTFIPTTGNALTVSISSGVDIFVEELQSEGMKASVFEIEISKPVKHNWYIGLVIDGLHSSVSPAHIIDGEYFSGSYNGIATNVRLGHRTKLISNLYCDIFGGFGFLLGTLPEIETSGMVGHIGTKLIYEISSWEIGYGVWHMSDPLSHGDKGWNMQLIVIGKEF